MEEADAIRMPGRSVPLLLLCDDSPVERMALGHYLRRQGYAVDEAGDGKSAIEHLKNREVDLVLLDLQMPGVDGFDVLSYLQQHRRGLPVILLSGMPLDQIQQKIHGLPMRELPPLFLKPVDLEQLLQVLELQLSGQLPDLDAPADTQDSLT
ncbi:response regulator transcription factor [Fontivita pretiosa]|uniref:response regulator transcription factor n=1 Tax=Fontivita pretiosa TaxID=2989684 RepID=UPI003D16F50D